jgi:hypothetical protein
LSGNRCMSMQAVRQGQLVTMVGAVSNNSWGRARRHYWARAGSLSSVRPWHGTVRRFRMAGGRGGPRGVWARQWCLQVLGRRWPQPSARGRGPCKGGGIPTVAFSCCHQRAPTVGGPHLSTTGSGVRIAVWLEGLGPTRGKNSSAVSAAWSAPRRAASALRPWAARRALRAGPVRRRRAGGASERRGGQGRRRGAAPSGRGPCVPAGRCPRGRGRWGCGGSGWFSNGAGGGGSGLAGLRRAGVMQPPRGCPCVQQ